jgi:hypothetical protein
VQNPKKVLNGEEKLYSGSAVNRMNLEIFDLDKHYIHYHIQNVCHGVAPKTADEIGKIFRDWATCKRIEKKKQDEKKAKRSEMTKLTDKRRIKI